MYKCTLTREKWRSFRIDVSKLSKEKKLWRTFLVRKYGDISVICVV